MIAKIKSANHGKIVVDVMDQFIDIFKMNAKHPSLKRQKLLHKHAFYTEVVLKGGVIMYCLAGAFYLIDPIYSYIFLDKMVPIFGIFFPYIDENTTVGYSILTAIQLVYMVLAVIATACTDFMFIMIIVNIPTLSSIFADEVEELNEALKAEAEEKEIDEAQVKGKFYNILFMHREIWE